jgi:hypothetical protein
MMLRLPTVLLRLAGPHRPWARRLLAYRVLAAVAEPRRLEPQTPRRP